MKATNLNKHTPIGSDFFREELASRWIVERFCGQVTGGYHSYSMIRIISEDDGVMRALETCWLLQSRDLRPLSRLEVNSLESNYVSAGHPESMAFLKPRYAV